MTCCSESKRHPTFPMDLDGSIDAHHMIFQKPPVVISSQNYCLMAWRFGGKMQPLQFATMFLV